MGLTSVRRLLAAAMAPPARANRPSSGAGNSMPAPAPATVLRHCRCADCGNFSRVGRDYFCSEYIGGTAVVWATGRRFCDPPPEAWHYCARYRGPQVSKDVWVWPRRSRQVGAGSTIAPGVEQGYGHAPVRHEHQDGQGGQGVIGTPPATGCGDRGGNGQEHPFCLSRT